jgi:hypothetical protein
MTMQSYLEQLKADTAKVNRKREAEARAKRPPADPRLTDGWKPLPVQIAKIWKNMPPDLRSRPVLVSELVPRLLGRYNPHPSAGDVGQALRSLKFTRARDSSGRRRWLPDPDTFS